MCSHFAKERNILRLVVCISYLNVYMYKNHSINNHKTFFFNFSYLTPPPHSRGLPVSVPVDDMWNILRYIFEIITEQMSLSICSLKAILRL